MSADEIRLRIEEAVSPIAGIAVERKLAAIFAAAAFILVQSRDVQSS